MKKKHLKLGACALLASLFTLSSCVDNDYDLTKDIDLTIQVGGSEFAIPGGETEPIKLSKILDIEEDGVVKTDSEGNYYLLQEGSESTTNISVNGFQVEAPKINPILIEPDIQLPTIFNINARANEKYPATLEKDKYNASFGLVLPDDSGNKLPAELKSANNIKVDLYATLDFSLEQDIVDAMYLEKITIEFPEYFISNEDLANGILTIENVKVTKAKGYHRTIHITEIDMAKLNQDGSEGTGIKDGKLDIKGKVVINGTVYVNSDDINTHPSSNKVELKALITLGEMTVRAVTGVVQPNINIDIAPVTLSGLPDFLDDEKVTLSVQNPMVFFMAKNNTPVAANVNGTITSFINKDNEEIPIGDPSKPVTFSLKLNKEEDQTFCLSPLAPAGMEGITHVAVPDLPMLINQIPDIFKFDVRTEATTDPTTISLGQTYSITTDYNVNVPFVFGKNITTIVYKDTVDGWYNDLKDYEIKQVNATATAFNKIPLGLKLTAKALTVDAQGKAEELRGVAITVIVDKEKDGTIKAGKNNNAVESTLVIEIRETTSGAVKRLDGLAFEIVAASATDAEGQQLNENQALQLKNVRLKVPGGAIIDLN